MILLLMHQGLFLTLKLKLTRSFLSPKKLVDYIHTAKDLDVRCIIINPGALTHSSIALRDALSGVGIPFIEVHISNTYAREDFRKNSYLSDIAEGVISGLGVQGYELALQKAIDKFG